MDGVTTPKSMRRFGLLLVACFVGVPLAAAPLAASQGLFRPLTINNQSVKVTKAFGADDEDCIYIIRHVPRPDGNLHTAKKLMCQG